MFRLTREIRFAAIDDAEQRHDAPPTNGYAGYPTLRGFAPWLTLQVTVAGELDTSNGYLINIKQIDSSVRRHAIPLLADAIRPAQASPEQAAMDVFLTLQQAWPGLKLERVAVGLSPFQRIAVSAEEFPMVQLSQKFEFSATHRLHNPSLSEAENCRIYGKCNNPHGHGHNYELQVTLSGKPGESGTLIEVPAFERIVASTVIEKFDHRNLNVELQEFRELIPTVENIAMVIYRLLKPRFTDASAKLASVTVWETPKTWCEYTE